MYFVHTYYLFSIYCYAVRYLPTVTSSCDITCVPEPPGSRNYVFFVREETEIVKEGIIFRNSAQSAFRLSLGTTSEYNET
jgi:hypothetical protein